MASTPFPFSSPSSPPFLPFFSSVGELSERGREKKGLSRRVLLVLTAARREKKEEKGEKS